MAVSGAASVELCGAGTYQDETGQSSCKDAQPGHFVATAGPICKTPCATGTTQDQPGQTSCNEVTGARGAHAYSNA